MRVGLAVLVATTGIVQVRKVETVDPFILHQLEQSWQIVGVVLGHGEARADLETEVAAKAHPRERFLEGAFHAPEAVMGFTDTVEADADIVEIDFSDLLDVFLGDQGPVGGQADIEAHLLGALRDFEDIRSQQRLAARQDQHRHMKTLEVVHDLVDFVGRQLTRKVLVRRNRVAMLAGQVATSNQVPDHHRAGWLAYGTERCRVGYFLHVLGDTEHLGPRLAAFWG